MNRNRDIVIIPNWKEDATSDTSFYRVLKSSIGVVGNKKDQKFIIALLFVSTVSTFVFSYFGLLAHPKIVSQIMLSWSTLLANVSVAILGFLIAGFSIFATMTRPSLFRYMSRYKAEGRPISDFKFVFYNFLYIFVHYLILLSVSIFLSFMMVERSPVWLLFKSIYQTAPSIIDLITVFVAVLFCIYVLYCILLLKSFLWNLYQTLIFAIFVDPPTN